MFWLSNILKTIPYSLSCAASSRGPFRSLDALPDRPTLALGDAVSASWIMKIGQHHKICCVFRCARAFHVDAAGLELTEHRSPAHAAQRPRAAPAIIAEPNRGYSHVIFDEIICVHPLLSPRIQALLRRAHNPPEMVGGLPATPNWVQSVFIVWI